MVCFLPSNRTSRNGFLLRRSCNYTSAHPLTKDTDVMIIVRLGSVAYTALELGPLFFPTVATTLINVLLYWTSYQHGPWASFSCLLAFQPLAFGHGLYQHVRATRELYPCFLFPM